MVNKETVRKVAETARISLTSQEVDKFEKELNEILESFSILEKAPTEGIKPSFQPIDLKNITRKDEVEPSLPREKALANTKNKEGPYFKGPKVV